MEGIHGSRVQPQWFPVARKGGHYACNDGISMNRTKPNHCRAIDRQACSQASHAKQLCTYLPRRWKLVASTYTMGPQLLKYCTSRCPQPIRIRDGSQEEVPVCTTRKGWSDHIADGLPCIVSGKRGRNVCHTSILGSRSAETQNIVASCKVRTTDRIRESRQIRHLVSYSTVIIVYFTAML